MAEALIFHHAQGLTAGSRAFADRSQAAGHQTHLPDRCEGRTYDSLERGVAHAQEVGFQTLIERGLAAAAELPEELVYVGFSLGVLPAQALAQTRAGARAAVLFHSRRRTRTRCGSAVPPQECGAWPELEEATLFLYPGDRHLFADESLPEYEPGAARQAEARVLELLDRLG